MKKTKEPVDIITVNGNCEAAIKVENKVIFDSEVTIVIQRLASAAFTNAQANSDNAKAIEKIASLLSNQAPVNISHVNITTNKAETGINIQG